MLSDVDYMSEGDEFGHQDIVMRDWQETYESNAKLSSCEWWIEISKLWSDKKGGIHDG